MAILRLKIIMLYHFGTFALNGGMQEVVVVQMITA